MMECWNCSAKTEKNQSGLYKDFCSNEYNVEWQKEFKTMRITRKEERQRYQLFEAAKKDSAYAIKVLKREYDLCHLELNGQFIF